MENYLHISKKSSTFAVQFKKHKNTLTLPAHVRNSDLYIDRLREADLISDFPGDELFIDGLHTMQNHFWNNGVNLEIPVVRVMNTAHFLAAYMFSTPCSGDQLEYDALADDSLGRDRKMFKVAIIVLAAMLARTEGFRARQCRNMLLENRDPDFDEGVSLYDRFLRSAEKRFAEENFLIDTHELIRQVNEQQEIIAQQKQEINTLKYTITTMESKYQQFNIGTQNNNCTQIGEQYNITYIIQDTQAPSSVSPEFNSGSSSSATDFSPEEIEEFKYIHVSVTDSVERAQINKMVCNIVRLPRMQQVCDELYILMKKRKVLCTINPEAMLKELRRIGLPGEDQEGFSQKNFQHYYRTPKID